MARALATLLCAAIVAIAACVAAATPTKVRYVPMNPVRNVPRSDATAQITSNGDRGLLKRCEKRYRKVPLDHFSLASDTKFKQRYFVCNEYYKPGGPIFFYLGNEADVTLYLNNTGLMWESAPSFEAMLIFAEHRYYGESKPFPGKTLRKHMHYLTTEQAMADYATLIWDLRAELGEESAPVIGFGGSYGGMLATWFRLKYPHLMDGAVAGSAPIWTFLGEDPPYDAGSFARIVTRDASPEGGSAPACAANARSAWQALFELSDSSRGRARARRALRLCPTVRLKSREDGVAVANWAQGAWDYLAMGNFPYASDYILNGAGVLPAYPVRAACEFLKEEGLEGEPERLLDAMAQAVGVYFNYSGALHCFDTGHGSDEASEEVADFWGWQFCTEQYMPMGRDGRQDMFWDQPFDDAATRAGCRKQWGIDTRPYWASVEWGGRRLEALSNVVFSNGLLDPWSGGGVLANLSDSLIAVVIPEGAHHIDLMFSNPADPPSVTQARETERFYMRKWVDEARDRVAPARSQLAERSSRHRKAAW